MQSSAVSTRSTGRVSPVAWLTAILLVGIVLPTVMAAATGSLSIPHNDAWAYSKVAQHFTRSGHIQLVGWNRGALVGQVIAFSPVAGSVLGQQIAMAVVGAAALIVTYLLGQRCGGRVTGIVAALSVAIFPGYALLSTSFMEDVPAYLAIVLGLLLAAIGLERDRTWLIVAGWAVGMLGVTVREQTIAVPAAIIVAAGWRYRRSRRALIGAVLLIVATVVLFGAFEAWRSSLDHSDALAAARQGTLYSLSKLFRAYYTVALVLVPALLVSLRADPLSRRGRMVAAAVAVIEVIAFVVLPHATGFLGGYLESTGPYRLERIGQRTVFPGWLILALEVVALAAGAVLIPQLWATWRRLNPLLLSFGVFTVLGTAVQIVVGQSVFDKYLFPLIPVLVIALVPRSVARLTAGSIVAAAAVMIVALAIAANGVAVDAREWRAGQVISRAGLAATDVNAGFDWYGYHAGGPADDARMLSHPSDPFYVTMFQGSRDCVQVRIQPPKNGTVLAETHYRTFALLGSSTMWIVDTGQCSLSPSVRQAIAARFG